MLKNIKTLQAIIIHTAGKVISENFFESNYSKTEFIIRNMFHKN